MTYGVSIVTAAETTCESKERRAAVEAKDFIVSKDSPKKISKDS